MPRADKAVKCREDGVTRFLSGYTVFFFMRSAVLEAVMRFVSVPSEGVKFSVSMGKILL